MVHLIKAADQHRVGSPLKNGEPIGLSYQLYLFSFKLQRFQSRQLCRIRLIAHGVGGNEWARLWDHDTRCCHHFGGGCRCTSLAFFSSITMGPFRWFRSRYHCFLHTRGLVHGCPRDPAFQVHHPPGADLGKRNVNQGDFISLL